MDDLERHEIDVSNEYLPQIESGGYRLTIDQDVTIKGTKENFHKDIDLVVQGPKFSIPSGLLYDKSPADGAISHDFEALVHVSFTQKTLPWMRSTALPSLEGRKPSWLVLLLLHESEADRFSQKKSMAFSDFFNNSTDVPFGKDVLIPKVDEEEKELIDLNSRCNMLLLEKDYFNQLAPLQEELHLFSHARKVNAEQKVLSKDLKDRQSEDNVEISLIVSNRKPQRGNNKAVLISIEDMGKYFPSGSERISQINDSYQQIAFFQLEEWSFQLQEDPAGFGALAKNLLNASDSYKLRLQVQDESIERAINLGFIPMAHHLRNGDKTLSWYRGPFTPEPVSDENIRLKNHSDQLERFNPNKGMFDESYASAWQIGRLIAMKDKAFTKSLMLWKEDLKSKNKKRSIQSNNRILLGLEAFDSKNDKEEATDSVAVEIIETVLKPKYDAIFKTSKKI